MTPLGTLKKKAKRGLKLWPTFLLLCAYVVFCYCYRIDVAQHFSCPVKTVECGHEFLLACRQLWKKGLV